MFMIVLLNTQNFGQQAARIVKPIHRGRYPATTGKQYSKQMIELNGSITHKQVVDEQIFLL